MVVMWLGLFIAIVVGIGCAVARSERTPFAAQPPSLWYHVHAADEVSGE